MSEDSDNNPSPEKLVFSGQARSSEPEAAASRSWWEIRPGRFQAFEEARASGGEWDLGDYARKIWAHGQGEPPPLMQLKTDVQRENPDTDFSFAAEFATEMRRAGNWAEEVAARVGPMGGMLR